MPLLRPFLFLVLAVLSVAPGRLIAQRVYWRPDQGTLGAEKVSELQLVFENCRPAGEVALPEVGGLQFGTPSTASETTIVNFEMSRRVILTYPVQPDKRGAILIPAFDVRTDIGKVAVGEARFTVGQAAIGGSGVSIGDITEARLRPSRSTVWQGEVVELDYVLAASPQFNSEIAGDPEWKPASVLTEALGEPKQSEENVRGQRWGAVRYSTRFIPTAPGQLSLEPIRQRVRVQTGERASFLFVQPRFEEYLVTSNRPEMTVRPLPHPAPAGFGGAVGTFELGSNVVPRHARLGEPITWTLKLAGSGNWPIGVGLPEREVSADFEVVQPKSRQEMEKNRLFTGSVAEDAVLVPTKAGTYTIGPVRFTYFDTAAGSYRTLATEAVQVTIHPGAAATSAPVASTSGSASAALQPSTGPTGALVAPPASLPSLPGDLPPVSAVLRMPLQPRVGWSLPPATRSPLQWLLVALTVPVLVWFALACRSGWLDDPARSRRIARAELLRLLQRMGRSSGPPDGAALEGWRIHAAKMWGIDRAVPTTHDLAAAISVLGGTAQPETWIALWREAESALFGRSPALPDSWTLRALAAVHATRVKRARPPLPSRGRHWTPYAPIVLAVLMMAGWLQDLTAADAYVAYREGRYGEARQMWTSQIDRDPADWSAHNNIALTFAQEERWAEALAHATAAFLLNPRELSLRANLRLVLARLDRVDPALKRLVEGSHFDRAVVTLAPGEWQVVETAGAVGIGLGLMLIVFGLYRSPRERAWRATGWTFVVLGAVAMGAGWGAIHHYGPLADPDAALIVQPTEMRSIPSELTERQQTAPIAPATVVVLRGDFLNWNQVAVGGSSTLGWVRRETIHPLFRKLPAATRATATSAKRPGTI